MAQPTRPERRRTPRLPNPAPEAVRPIDPDEVARLTRSQKPQPSPARFVHEPGSIAFPLVGYRVISRLGSR